MASMEVSAGANANSAFGDATVTAPTLGQALVTSLPTGGVGLYQIRITCWLSAGTPAAVDNKNLEFRFGATTLTKLPLLPALNMATTTTLYFKSDGSTNFSVNATAAGTAGVTYNVTFVATRLA